MSMIKGMPCRAVIQLLATMDMHIISFTDKTISFTEIQSSA